MKTNLPPELTPLVLPPVNRHQLALYAAASGDLNPIHLDLDFAQRAGYPDVFMQGMQGMAWLGRLLTNNFPQAQVLHFSNRFTAITHLGDVITCTGRVVGQSQEADHLLLQVELESHNQRGEPTQKARATLRQPLPE